MDTYPIGLIVLIAALVALLIVARLKRAGRRKTYQRECHGTSLAFLLPPMR
ncbi:hypothetical protein [Bradyrhizobium australiense]|uniref:Uncharacterized protein n=1 Tax=Bradyrhizobium australiense TaxID=2721161 RepID=A0A7Y4GWM7_9BRAD|nr:hypothetical protein [Bradyrhizobium australiense]NOJ43114.1 hypothetical protein [Bradyrhizobium australiense]